MAVFVYTNAYLSANSQNLSPYVVSLTTNFKLDEVDVTAMNSAAAKSFLAGLLDARAEVELLQDFANSASATDQAVSTIWTAKAAVAIEIRPVNATVTTSNPKWTGNAFVFEYNPVDAQVGQRGTIKVPLVFSGGVTRGTS